MNSAALKLPTLLALVLILSVGKSFAQIPANDDLKIQLSKVFVTSSSPLFQVQLKNVGNQDLMLNLGTMLGNGHKQYLNAVHFTLRGSSERVLSLDLIGPAIIGGRVDSLVVPLAAGAEYTFPVDLHKYCACKQSVWELEPLHGHYTLQANYQGNAIPLDGTNLDMRGVALFHVWTGDIRSQMLSFHAHKEHVKPVHPRSGW